MAPVLQPTQLRRRNWRLRPPFDSRCILRSPLCGPRKFTKDVFSGGRIGGVRLFLRGEMTEMFAFAVDPNAGLPRLAVCLTRPIAGHAFEAGFVGGDKANVGLILRFGCEPQVRPNVIVLIEVTMMKKRRRPLACHVEPCEMMRAIDLIIDRNDRIFALAASGNITSLLAAAINQPKKNPREGVIREQFFETFLSDFHPFPRGNTGA